MNRLSNKGQALVILVVFIPLFIMFGTIIVDVTYSKYEKRHVDEVNKMVLKYAINHNDENTESYVSNLINQNIKDVEGYDFNINSETGESTLTIRKNVSGFFGKIIGKDIYKINSSYTGVIEDEKVVIKEAGS